jgi:hypothetical protein
MSRTGKWTDDEEAQLTQIVKEMTVQQGTDISTDIFWVQVSQAMGGTRNRQQCAEKWFAVACNVWKYLLIQTAGKIPWVGPSRIQVRNCIGVN